MDDRAGVHGGPEIWPDSLPPVVVFGQFVRYGRVLGGGVVLVRVRFGLVSWWCGSARLRTSETRSTCSHSIQNELETCPVGQKEIRERAQLDWLRALQDSH
jgi:hypothetical protein